MLMQALSENMSEGSSESPELPAPEPVESRSALARAKTSFSHLPGSQLIQAKEKSLEASPKKVHVFMVFRFTMDSLVINLYSGGSETVSCFFEICCRILLYFLFTLLSAFLFF